MPLFIKRAEAYSSASYSSERESLAIKRFANMLATQFPITGRKRPKIIPIAARIAFWLEKSIILRRE